MSARAGLRVQDVLDLEVVRRGLPQVVCGGGQLARPVRWAHVVDLPHVGDLLRGDELVLSTGSALGDDSGAQRDFIAQLVDEHAAGLLLELGTAYRRSPPAAMVAEATKADFPLIALQRRVRFVEITEAVHASLIGREVLELRRADELQTRFLDILLNGGGVPEVLEALARIIANPVVLENAGRQVIAHATHRATDDLVLSAWESSCRLGDAGDEPGTIEAEVSTLGRVVGRLIALEIDTPLDDFSRLALEHAATTVSLEMRRHNYDDYLQAQTRGLLLTDLAHSRLSEDDAARRAATQGFSRRPGRMLPIVASWRSGRWQSLGASMDMAWAALTPALKQAVASHSRSVVLGPAGADLLTVLDVDTREMDTRQLDDLAESFWGPLRRRGFGPEDITVAIGPTEQRWEPLGQALLATIQAAGVARALVPVDWHDARRSSVTDFLFAIRSLPELSHFIDRQLGPLLDAERHRERGLLTTLETYLAKGGRKAEAARALNVERQSLYARLRRIETLLGVQLDEEDVLLSLHLACRARRLLGELGSHGDG